MKKFILVILIPFFFCQCQKEVVVVEPQPQMAPVPNIPPTHPLKQFEGIPVYIYPPAGPGVAEGVYLTEYPSNIPVKYLKLRSLFVGNETKYRITQQWYLKAGTGLRSNCFSIESRMRDLSQDEIYSLFSVRERFATMSKSHFISISFDANNNPTKSLFSDTPCYFNISEEVVGSGRNTIRPYAQTDQYFLRYPYYGEDLYFAANDNSQFREFIISPVEDFELSEVRYSLQSGDGALPIPSFVDEIIVSNRTGQQQSMSASFTRKASETSSFSKTKNISLSLAASVKVSVPIINLDASLSVSRTSSNTWTFGNSETQEDSRTYSFSLVVPPYSNYRATISVAMYEATATYTAVYRGVNSGRTVTLTGKWNGIKAGLITYDIYDFSGNHLAKIQGVPNKELNLAKIKDQTIFSFE